MSDAPATSLAFNITGPGHADSVNGDGGVANVDTVAFHPAP
jgi:hypothetical protein